MNCVINKENNTFLTNQQDIISSCLDILGNIQIKDKYDPYIPNVSLPSLDHDTVKFLQNKMSRNKGLTGYGLSGTWIATTEHNQLLCNLWRPDIIKMLPLMGRARLIPLNKVWPQIPTKE